MKYENPTPGELPIVANGMLPNYSYYTTDICKLIKECHVNVVQSQISPSNKLENVTCGFKDSKKGTLKQGSDCFNRYNPDGFGLNFSESIKNASENGLKFIVRKSFHNINDIPQINPLYINSEGQYKWEDQFNAWRKLAKNFKNPYPSNDAVSDEVLTERKSVIGWMFKDEPSVADLWVLRGRLTTPQLFGTTN